MSAIFVDTFNPIDEFECVPSQDKTSLKFKLVSDYIINLFLSKYINHNINI